MNPKKIIIVDDHPLFREGLKSIISRNPELELVGETGVGREALKLAENFKPDMVVMDISLPDSNGIELTKDIKKLSPATRVLIVSVHSKIDYITAAFQAGATGYVVKDAPSAKILQALELVSQGEYFLDGSVSYQVVKKLSEFPEQKAKTTDPSYNNLTTREQEIFRLLAEDVKIRDIADKLYISPKTVENHKTNIMSKLNLHSTLDLVRYAVKLGIIDVEHWKG
ncbi:MAG: response regulator transcription factor [Syntrophobacterales bacterium]